MWSAPGPDGSAHTRRAARADQLEVPEVGAAVALAVDEILG